LSLVRFVPRQAAPVGYRALRTRPLLPGKLCIAGIGKLRFE
jgi:hypothetical protein